MYETYLDTVDSIIIYQYLNIDQLNMISIRSTKMKNNVPEMERTNCKQELCCTFLHAFTAE